MVYLLLVLFGLVIGSFINALVWRVHEQESDKKDKKLSITKGRSLCPTCKHQLKAFDLIPVVSWVFLNGKCRYCKKPISIQYPLVELTTVILYLICYVLWPYSLESYQSIALFISWLCLLTGFIALSIYDIKWFILPNRLIYSLWPFAMVFGILNYQNRPAYYLINILISTIIGGGIFYLIYMLSKGKWIGGGDIRLGWMLGFIAATPARSVMFIFIASLIGTAISLLFIITKRFKKHQLIPFGPFLMLGLVVVQLFGNKILDWYLNRILIG